MQVTDNLAQIKQKISQVCSHVNRKEDEINIIAVTKYVSVERAHEALDAGVIHLGENRDEGLLEKWDVLKNKPTWHFIGSLQTRKVKKVIDYIDYLHSLDRLSLAEEIEKRAAKTINCFVQVNTSGEVSKHGLHPSEVIPFIKQLQSFEKISVVGLMTMAPNTNDQETIRTCFRKLSELKKEVQALQAVNAPCNELSMGMSNDFHIAIEEGATYIRIGSALVG